MLFRYWYVFVTYQLPLSASPHFSTYSSLSSILLDTLLPGLGQVIMESRGLTLRSKSRRARPQISAPKPISKPLPSSSSTSDNVADPRNGSRERPQQSGATSDLVKRRYSARYNQVPDLEANAPPVPGLPPGAAKYAGMQGPTRATPVPGQRPTVDKEELMDPSLQVDRCERDRVAFFNQADGCRCRRETGQCHRRRD